MPHGVRLPSGRPVTYIRAGDRIGIGRDRAHRPVSLRVHALPGRRPGSITLLDPVSRVLLAGDALGVQGTRGLTLTTSRESFLAALARGGRRPTATTTLSTPRTTTSGSPAPASSTAARQVTSGGPSRYDTP